MSEQERPFICNCSFCFNGRLRFVQCDTCDEVVALCDACELMWSDIAGVADDANLSSGSTHPICPHCGDEAADFHWLTSADVKGSQLECYVDRADSC